MKRISVFAGALLCAAGCAHKPVVTTAPAAAPAPVVVTPAAAADKAPDVDPWAAQTDLITAPAVSPSTKVDIGQVARGVLPNGLRTLVVARHAVPMVDVTLAIEAGRTADPVGQSGLAQFTASMLRKGTAARSADQIAEAIDFVGGDLDASSDEEGTFVSCHARARDLALCLDLVADVAERPTFPEAEMAEIRDQLQSQVEGAKDSPPSLASLHARNVYFGDADSRGRPVSEASLAKIDRAALVAFHKARYAPNASILAISGDVDEKTLKGQLARAFGGWKKHAVPKRAEPVLPDGKELRVRLVDKPDATQSAIVLVGPGIAHAAPDFYAVRLMNFAFGGGGFSSRLMKVVRSDGAKTYGARAAFEARRQRGLFSMSTLTRNTETVATIKLLLGEMDKMRAGGPTDDELAAARGNLIGGYGMRLETASDVAESLLVAALDGLDPDYVERVPERLAKVTREEAAAAAAAHLSATALVVVGKAAEVKPLLEAAGYKVTDVTPYTAPVSPAERAAPEAAAR